MDKLLMLLTSGIDGIAMQAVAPLPASVEDLVKIASFLFMVVSAVIATVFQFVSGQTLAKRAVLSGNVMQQAIETLQNQVANLHKELERSRTERAEDRKEVEYLQQKRIEDRAALKVLEFQYEALIKEHEVLKAHRIRDARVIINLERLALSLSATAEQIKKVRELEGELT